MSIHSVRIPEDIEMAIAYVAKHEKLEKSQSLRKLAKLGFEHYVAVAYREGRVTLREVSELTGTTASEALDLLAQMGVRGNVRVADVLASLVSLPRVSGKTADEP